MNVCNICKKLIIKDYLNVLKNRQITTPKEAFCLCQQNGLIDVEGRVVKDEL